MNHKKVSDWKFKLFLERGIEFVSRMSVTFALCRSHFLIKYIISSHSVYSYFKVDSKYIINFLCLFNQQIRSIIKKNNFIFYFEPNPNDKLFLNMNRLLPQLQSNTVWTHPVDTVRNYFYLVIKIENDYQSLTTKLKIILSRIKY